MIFKPGLLNYLTLSLIRKILNLLIGLIGVIHRVRFERILPPRILGRRISKSKKTYNLHNNIVNYVFYF